MTSASLFLTAFNAASKSPGTTVTNSAPVRDSNLSMYFPVRPPTSLLSLYTSKGSQLGSNATRIGSLMSNGTGCSLRE